MNITRNLLIKPFNFLQKYLFLYFFIGECLFVQILLAFSAYTNAKKLFKSNRNDNFKCLDGIRVLSLGKFNRNSFI